MSGNWYTVGIIVNTHGIRGDLKVISKTDFPEQRFAKGSQLLMVHEETGQKQIIEIEQSREHKGVYIIKLKGYNNINDVESFKGWHLKISEEQQGQLEDGEYYYHQIIGCKVTTDEGIELGTVTEILSPGANDVWVVQPAKGKPILIPVIDPVVLHVDVKEKQITVHILEGLIS